MALLINLRHLEDKNLHLQGELSAQELEIEHLDEVIHVQAPLSYDLQAQKLEHAALVMGLLKLDLECECVRCLTPFRYTLRLEGWVCHLPLVGDGDEDKALV